MPCPFCHQQIAQTCNFPCRLGCSRCVAGHAWFLCPAHGRPVLNEAGLDMHHFAVADGACLCMGDAGFADKTCPACGAGVVMMCGCELGDSRCAGGHAWHVCVQHGQVIWHMTMADANAAHAMASRSSCTCNLHQVQNDEERLMLHRPSDRTPGHAKPQKLSALRDSMAWNGESTASTQEDLWSNAEDDLDTEVVDRLYPPEQDSKDYVARTQRAGTFGGIANRPWMPTGANALPMRHMDSSTD